MVPRRKNNLQSGIKAGILTDKDVKNVVRRIHEMLTPDTLSIIERFTGDTESSIRLSLLSSKCRTRREELGWDLKDAGEKVGIPQYRIRAMESGHRREFSQKEVRLSSRRWESMPGFRNGEKPIGEHSTQSPRNPIGCPHGQRRCAARTPNKRHRGACLPRLRPVERDSVGACRQTLC